jgi:hypothetical protein
MEEKGKTFWGLCFFFSYCSPFNFVAPLPFSILSSLPSRVFFSFSRPVCVCVYTAVAAAHTLSCFSLLLRIQINLKSDLLITNFRKKLE